MRNLSVRVLASLALTTVAVVGCSPSDGLAVSEPAEVTVKFDFDHRPLPDIPLPIDVATRPDDTSVTGIRVNASMIAPTQMERRIRTLVDSLDGWGVYQPVTIPFTGPIDVNSILSRHRDEDYDQSNDAIYLINIDTDSDEYGRLHHIDIGEGNYPVVLEALDKYGENDPRGWSLSLPFDEADEDLNGNAILDPGEDLNRNGVLDAGEDRDGDGVLDPPEDTDADGFLDKPNYLPGHTPARDDLIGRADALMGFYERETSTIIVSPMTPLQEQTLYGVIVTKRIRDLDGNPVGSPFPYINHTAQTKKLEPILDVLPPGIELDDVAFAFAYTTESITPGWISVREGLYGIGPQAHIGEEFPPSLTQIFQVKEPTHPGFEGRNPFILNQEDWRPLLSQILKGFFEGGNDQSEQFKAIVDSHDYVDFHAMGTYTSPQLFERYDDAGNVLPLDLQSWPIDLHDQPIPTRAEEIPFWVVMPRKETSVRGEGKMAPLVLLGHGYGSNRGTELMGFAGFFTQYGAAVISTDNVSHGIPIEPDIENQFRPLLEEFGLGRAFDAIKFARGGFVDDDGDGVVDRHYQDLDRSGTINSGADFWTAYLFHMRDMVRQSAYDYMQLIRTVRSWDGKKTWQWDMNGNGVEDDLAGDFDGDGNVDIGSESDIFVLGASLGGIMATTLGSLEPEVSGIIPIAGGGRLADVGNRSLQGGVPQAVLMRAMAPLYLTTLDDDGVAHIAAEVVELTRLKTIPLADLPGVLVGDTMVVVNMDNEEVACAYILPDEAEANGVAGRARTSIASDIGDKTEIRIYRGPALVTGSDECEVVEDAEPIFVVDSFPTPFEQQGEEMVQMTFEGLPIEGGELRSFMEGLGLRRANPELRRFMTIAQLVVDPSDPGVLSRHLAAEPFVYPNKGDVTGANFMIVTTQGDMNVPAHGGVTVGRGAGVIDFLNPDPRYGKPVNQVLIDTYSVEAVNTYGRHVYANPPADEKFRDLLRLDESLGVHVDVENFSGGDDIWGDNVPRLENPLRLMMTTDMWGNDLKGWSGAIFPYAIPQGQHGFALPGEMTDWAINLCREEFGSAADCDKVGKTFDVGWHMFHMFGRYFQTRAQVSPFREGCNTKTACEGIPPTPEVRAADQLP